MHTQKMKESDDERKRIIQEFQDDRTKQHSRGVASSKHRVELSGGVEEFKGHRLGRT